MEKFILIGNKEICFAGTFNTAEEIIEKIEGEYGSIIVKQVKEHIIRNYGEINKTSILNYYHDGDMEIYFLNDIDFK